MNCVDLVLKHLETILFVLAVIWVGAMALVTFWVILAAILASNPPAQVPPAAKLAEQETCNAQAAEAAGHQIAAQIHRANAATLRKQPTQKS